MSINKEKPIKKFIYNGEEIPIYTKEPNLETKTVTPTKSTQEIVADADYDGLEKVIIEPISDEYIIPSLQSKSVTPTKSSQTIVADIDYDGISQVTVNPIPSEYIVPSGTLTITENGTNDVTGYASVNVNVPEPVTKNVQCYQGYATVSSTSYTATSVSLTVAKTGTYTVSWMGWRSTSSGTSGSQLYIDNTAYGSATTSFTNTYGQNVKLTNVSLTEGQTLTIRARSRSSSYVMGVGNLTIVEN